MKTLKTLIQICQEWAGFKAIEAPRTKVSDYIAYMKDQDSIETRLTEGEINVQEAQREKKELIKAYESKVFLTDQHLFDTETQLYEFLVTEAKLRPETARDAVQHEREHFEAAIKRPSVSIKYGCFLLRQDNSDKVSCQPFVYVEATYGQLKRIIPHCIDAVAEKSSYDLEQERKWKF